jgi:hypothetical protein
MFGLFSVIDKLQVVSLWKGVNEAIERLPRTDSQVLLHFESLITSGFVSRRRSIVNISIATWNKTFGKEDDLRYPKRLEAVLRRLHNSVELVLPSLDLTDDASVSSTCKLQISTVLTKKKDAELSFYDSDESTNSRRRSARSSRIKESPFKIMKPERNLKPQSPTVSSPASRRTSSRRTPKIRLRHDNSQIHFEAIVSSPTNPFVQDSQILTERQKEMIERQRLSGGLFADMGALSPQHAPPSPLELHSDVQSIDDLPTRKTRTTPLKALAKMGPMDVFLGSSPTPHARRNSQKIVSDDTDIATPTAVRTVRVSQDQDLHSSPPWFDKQSLKSKQLREEDATESSVYQRSDRLYSASFDDGTTMDEEALAAAAQLAEEEEQLKNHFEPSDDIMSDAPSSTIDMQLTAQFDADTQTAEATTNPAEPVQELHSVFVDAASHPTTQSNVPATQDGSDTEVAPIPKSVRGRKGRRADTSSTSRVEDSCNSTPGRNTPRSQDVRRSTRHSMDSPVHIELSRVKKQKKPRRSQKDASVSGQISSPVPSQLETADEELEPAVVASPIERMSNAKKRKSMDESPTNLNTPTKSGRKRGMPRSQSNLSQVESVTDVPEGDRPAPSKRARQSLDMDVSEAKFTPPPPPQEQHSSSKRISHVQVTPRHIKASAPAVAEQIAASIITVADTVPTVAHSALVQNQIQPQQQTANGSATPNRSFAERVILTPRSIINKIVEIKNYFLNAPRLTMTLEEEHELDNALFHIRRNMHAAGIRGEGRDI